MLAVMQQEDTARPLRHEKGEEGSICLCCVARATGEDKIVRPVVRGLPFPRTHMVQRDGLGGNARAAVRAHGSMSREKPLAMRTIGTTGGASKAGTTGTAAAGLCCRACGGLTTAKS